MKTFTEEVWYETNKDGTISIGFTQDYIRRKMPECFHVVQADVKNVAKDTPMLVVETNDCLESVRAPITGRVKYFNHKARDFPDQLKETDVVLTVAPPEIKEESGVKQWEAICDARIDQMNVVEEEFMRNIYVPQAPRGVR